MLFFKKYGFSCGAALLILYLSLAAPSQDAQKLLWFEGQDKVVHFLMYAFLAFVLAWDFYRQKTDFATSAMYLAAVALPILYGGAIEVLQENFFPPRSGDWCDWLADMAGAATGYCAARLVVPKVAKRR